MEIVIVLIALIFGFALLVAVIHEGETTTPALAPASKEVIEEQIEKPMVKVSKKEEKKEEKQKEESIEDLFFREMMEEDTFRNYSKASGSFKAEWL